MIQQKTHDPLALLAENLVRLYLRLNGYLPLGGYLLHRPKGGDDGLRTEIDALAVRFPHQREPLHDGADRREQENDPGLILPKELGLIDFIVAEVKTGDKPPRFNSPLVRDDKGAQQSLDDLLNMLGCFKSQEEIISAASSLLTQLQKPYSSQSPTYALRSGQAQIRFLLFWDQRGDANADRFFIPLSHILKFVAKRTEPGTECAPYSRWHAHWRGADLCILEAIDALRSAGKVCENLREIEEHILKTLGKDIIRFL
jgi:hypothetical protein